MIKRILFVLVALALLTGLAAIPSNALDNQPPVPIIAGGPYEVNEGSSISLDGSGSYDPDGDPLIYTWSWNDKCGSHSESGPSLVFYGCDGPETVDVYLEVSDGQDTMTAKTTVTVNNVAPEIAWTEAFNTVGLTVTADASFYDPGVADTHVASWDWGDGESSPGTVKFGALGWGSVGGDYPFDNHTYAAPGEYTITLTVTDDDLGQDTDNYGPVSVGNQPPVADAGGPYSVDEGSSINLDGTYSYDPEGDPLTYLWSWTDKCGPHSASGPTPVFYGCDGLEIVDVTLEVSDGFDTMTAQTTVTVNNVAPEIAWISVSSSVGLTVYTDASFYDPGLADTHVATWDWGDGSTSPGTVKFGALGWGSVGGAADPPDNHTYAAPGDYTVTLTVTDDDSGQDTDSYAVSVGNQLVVTKDAQTSLTRTYYWNIGKFADHSEVNLAIGEWFDVNYTVKVEAGLQDSNWAVKGNIAVNNPTSTDVVIAGVSDMIHPTIVATVDCGCSFPYTLAAGETLNCTYQADLPDASSRTNKATVTLEDGTQVSGTADVDFSNSVINEVDECIDVYDSYAGFLGTICPPHTDMTFNYVRQIGPYDTCGKYTVKNTATFVTNDTGTTGSRSVLIDGSITCPQICAVKFYDANLDGAWEVGEPWLAGWPINIYNEAGVLVDTIYTSGEVGNPACIALAPGTYTATEVVPLPPGWVATTPTSQTFTLADVGEQGLLFGNVCLGGGGGLTIGFWSNKNGQALVSSNDLTFLSSLCLVNARGNVFDPLNKSALKSWLLKADATNMAYMLSAQLAAMELNVRHGFVNGDRAVWTGSEFITINDLMAEAAAALCLDGYTPKQDPNRADQEYLMKALNSANNNLNFTNPTPCAPPTGPLCVAKFYDANGNGVWNTENEPLLDGWPVEIRNANGDLVATLSTSADYYNPACISVPIGEYTATEIIPDTWQNTTPSSFVLHVTPDGAGALFGNIPILQVSKTASTSFTRFYDWSIDKSADPTEVWQTEGTAIFNYATEVAETGFTDSDWKVSGVITVTNPTDQDVMNVKVEDTLFNASWTVDVAAGSSVEIEPDWVFPDKPPYDTDLTNTAIVHWADGHASAEYTATFQFTEPTLMVNKTVHITDTYAGTLGTVTATDELPFAGATFNYIREVPVPTSGCQSYDNTATILETGQSSTVKVIVCRLD